MLSIWYQNAALAPTIRVRECVRRAAHLMRIGRRVRHVLPAEHHVVSGRARQVLDAVPVDVDRVAGDEAAVGRAGRRDGDGKPRDEQRAVLRAHVHLQVKRRVRHTWGT